MKCGSVCVVTRVASLLLYSIVVALSLLCRAMTFLFCRRKLQASDPTFVTHERFWCHGWWGSHRAKRQNGRKHYFSLQKWRHTMTQRTKDDANNKTMTDEQHCLLCWQWSDYCTNLHLHVTEDEARLLKNSWWRIRKRQSIANIFKTKELLLTNDLECPRCWLCYHNR